MNTIRNKLVLFAVCTLPVVAYAQIDLPQKFLVFEDAYVQSHATGEAVEYLVAVGNLPGNREDPGHTVQWIGFEICCSGNLPVIVNAPISGFAKFRVEVGHETSSGEVPLIVNGQKFCCVAVENNRVSYRVNLSRSKQGFNSITGEYVEIPSSVGISTSVHVFDLATGTTRSSKYIFRPVIVERTNAEP